MKDQVAGMRHNIVASNFTIKNESKTWCIRVFTLELCLSALETQFNGV